MPSATLFEAPAVPDIPEHFRRTTTAAAPCFPVDERHVPAVERTR
ncbi:hypothetical protein [Streptomyces sp. NPDC057253]